MLGILTVLMCMLYGAGLTIGLIGLFFLFRFHAQKRPLLRQDRLYPKVSILKCCRGAQDNEAENFRVFFQQDYPGPWELVFIVDEDCDPICPIIHNLQAEFPHVRCQRVIPPPRPPNFVPKVHALRAGHEASFGDIIIWSDSDVIVKTTYLSEMVASLEEPGVSLVTSPQFDARANNFGSAYKVLGNNADVITFVMSYDGLVRPKKVALGHSLGFWKKEFESLHPQPWAFLGRFFADDLGLPKLFIQKNKKIVFRNIYCPVETSDKTLGEMIRQKKRWVLCQRYVVGNRWIYLSGMLFYPQIAALLLVLLTAGSRGAG